MKKNSLKFEFRVSFRFLLCLKEKDGKAFGKNTVTFCHDDAYPFVCFVLGMTTITDNVLKLFIVLHEKMQKTNICVEMRL